MPLAENGFPTMTQLTADQAFSIAIQHHNAGRWQQAEEVYRKILAAEPRHAETLHHLGLLANQFGHADGESLIRQARAIDPSLASAYSNLGHIVQCKGRVQEAIELCRRGVELNPSMPHGLNNYGNALQAVGRLDEAEGCFRRALALKEDFPEAHNNMCNILQTKKQFDAAVAHGRRATQLRPEFGAAHLSLARAWCSAETRRREPQTFRRELAADLHPNDAEILGQIGVALHDLRDYQPAIACFHRSLALGLILPKC